MRYYLLKFILNIALRLYLGRVEKQGLELVDNNRPTLILANHTNSFLDTFVIGWLLRRRVYCFVRGDMFEKKWADKLMRSVGLLPIYRSQEGRDKLHRNEASNEEAIDILKKGGAVIIYAEGGSDTAKVLKPLKKGPFRLAAMAAAQLEHAPVIAPMGVNYTEPTQPFTNVYLQVGRVTDTAGYRDEDETGQSRAALQLLRQVSSDLAPVAWHVAQPELEPVADGLLRLQQLHKTPPFDRTKALIDRLNSLDPETAARLKADWELFQSLEKRTGARMGYGRRISVSGTAFLLLAAVPGFAGWLFHFLPLRLSREITDRKVKWPDFLASVFISLAIIFTLTWYLATAILFAVLIGPGRALLLLAIAAVCGVLYLKACRHPLQLLRQQLLNRRAARKYPEAWKRLQELYGELSLFLHLRKEVAGSDKAVS